MTSRSTAVARRAPAALLASALVLSLLAALTFATPAEGAPGRTADKPWSGYRLRASGTAAGDYLGARQFGGVVVYRIDPQAKASRSASFGPPVYTDVLAGSGQAAVSQQTTAQAAWILGKYGAYRLKVQTAAVELALDHLLVGGTYALKGARTKQRLSQLGESRAKKIVSFAQQMLLGAARYASTYAVTLTSTPTVTLGQQLGANLVVRSTATGAGIANLPVTFTYPGVAPQVVRTDANGSAAVTFASSAAGPQTVSANVANVPETRLIVLTPTTKKASRVVVADVKTASSATASTAVQAVPTLSITRSYGSIASPYETTGQKVALAGTYPTARTATATLFGPYASDAAANCKGTKTAGKGTVAMKADGSYALPTLTMPTAGYYRWYVTLPADAYNTAPTAICAGVQVRS